MSDRQLGEGFDKKCVVATKKYSPNKISVCVMSYRVALGLYFITPNTTTRKGNVLFNNNSNILFTII